MSCGCPSPDTCGCYFATSGDITATGTGALDNPIAFALAAGKLPTLFGNSDDKPVSPVEGQLYFETDTNRLRLWEGSRWRLVSSFPTRTQQFLNGAAINHLGGGDVIVIDDTVSEPFGVGDPYDLTADVTLVVLAPTGDVWDARLYVEGTEIDKCRLSFGVDGWATAKLYGFWGAHFGQSLQITVRLTSIGGSGNFSTFTDCSPSPTNVCNRARCILEMT